MLVFKVRLVVKVFKELKDQQEQQVHRVFKVQLDQPAIKDRLVLPGCLVFLEHRVLKGQLVLKACRVQLDLVELLVHKVQLE
jgi:hypothetical protein